MGAEEKVGKITSAAVLQSLKDTLLVEADSLTACAQRLDESFVRAVQLILKCSGKVILTGLGKSGHIAHKIAATMASTGTPAFFLHPSEALHGDLGMIGKDDVVLALAFGGETREVVEVAKFAKRNTVPIIAISGNRTSSLATLAEVFLDGSVAREACPLNLAPTSSSSLALAIGDALAVALMHARGFIDIDFAKFHPEGSLGKRLSTVSDFMKVIDARMTLTRQATFEDVLQAVMSANYGFAVVLEPNGTLAGVMTDGDVRRAVASHREQVFTKKAEDLMSSHPKYIGSKALAMDAVQQMEKYSISVLLVFADEIKRIPAGIIRMHDLLVAKVV